MPNLMKILEMCEIRKFSMKVFDCDRSVCIAVIWCSGSISAIPINEQRRKESVQNFSSIPQKQRNKFCIYTDRRMARSTWQN